MVHQQVVIPCARKQAQGSSYGAFSSGPAPGLGQGGRCRQRALWSRQRALWSRQEPLWPAEGSVAPTQAAVAGRGRCSAGAEGPGPRSAAGAATAAVTARGYPRQLQQTLAPFFIAPGRIKKIWSTGIIYGTVLLFRQLGFLSG